MAPRRPTLPSAVFLLAALVVGAGCVEFQEVRLYDGFEASPPPERPRTLRLAVEPEVFTDQNDDQVWFEEANGCTQGEVTDEVVFEGRRAIKVSWDRGAEGCEWAGFGIGWDNWAGKDLSSLLPYAAFRMQVRSQEGRMFGLPIVLTLEDYSGGMGFAYTDNRYFERTFIDEEWQAVTVPLAAFDIEVEGLDVTNVKQLMFELQQGGAVYIDDVELIFYEEPEQEPWLVEAPRPSPTALPIQLFGDAFINGNGWGLVTDACQSFAIEEGVASEGAAALHLRWDVEGRDCVRAELGVSWDKWYPVDATAIADRAAIQLDVRLAEGRATSLPVRVGLQDYGRAFASVPLTGSFSTEWTTVTVPFGNLVGDADVSNLKQLYLTATGSGEVFIDNVRLVEDF